MLNKMLSYLSDFFIFLFIFSFFNDNFMVDLFGEKSLKILFLLFFTFYFPSIMRNMKTMSALQEKLFFAFFTVNLIIFLVQIILYSINDILIPALLLIANFAIVLYFSRYQIEKLLYFIWISMMISIIICYFNGTIDPWSFRKTGGTEDANEFATQLLIFLFTSIYLYLKNINKIFLLISIIFFIYGFFHAASMSSFLILGIIGIFSTARLVIANPKFLFNYKILLGLLLLIGLFSQIEVSKINTITNILNRTKDTHTAAYRIHNWIAGQHMIEKNFSLGVGLNQFANNTRKYEEGYLAGNVPAPHNIYIKLFAESGFFVFVLFITFIAYIIIRNFKKLFHSNYSLIATMLISTLLMGMTLGITYDKYFWLLIALMMNVNYQLKRTQNIS